MRFAAVRFSLLLLLTSSVAHAELSKGTYAELHLGGRQFLGAGKDNIAMGPTFGVRAGLDLFRWLAFGFDLGSSIHKATIPPPPKDEYFQLSYGAGTMDLRLQFGPWRTTLGGMAGLAHLSTNVLDRVEITTPSSGRVTYIAGGDLGFERRLRDPHFSIGIRAGYRWYSDFDNANSVGTTLYLRYTR